MIKKYYIVVNYVMHGHNRYPNFTTCTLKDDKFFRINDLDAYLNNNGGVTDEEIIFDEFFLVSDTNWKNSMILSFNK